MRIRLSPHNFEQEMNTHDLEQRTKTNFSLTLKDMNILERLFENLICKLALKSITVNLILILYLVIPITQHTIKSH